MGDTNVRKYTDPLFHAKLMMRLTNSATCSKVFYVTGISQSTLYQHISRRQRYSDKSFGCYFFQWFDDLQPAAYDDSDNIEMMVDYFVLFAKEQLSLNLKVLHIYPDKAESEVYYYRDIVGNIIKKWFKLIDNFYVSSGKLDDLVAYPALAVSLKKAAISILCAKDNRAFLREHTDSYTWKRFQEEYKFGIVLNAIEIEADAKEYLDTIIRFGSKSIQARDRIYDLAIKGNLMACYEIGNVELYAHDYDMAWRWWTKNKKDNEGTVLYSSSLISLADILIQHKEYSKSESFERLKAIPSFAEIYAKVDDPKAYEVEILKLLISAATKDNAIAYNMIGNEIKNHNDIINFVVTESSTDSIVSALNDLLSELPSDFPELHNHPYLRFFEYAGNCGNAFSKNVFFKEIAFSSKFNDASRELRLKAVKFICESAELGNHYGLTKAAPFLMGAGFPANLCDDPCERLADISVKDIDLPEYKNLRGNQYVEKGYKYLTQAIRLAEHSNYYMPYVCLAYYFNSNGPYYEHIKRLLENDEFTDEIAHKYLDIAIEAFKEKDIPRLMNYKNNIAK